MVFTNKINSTKNSDDIKKKNGVFSNVRVKYLDIAKGLGIILVVWAHAKGPYSKYIYQFHMPLFFIISGYLHNNRNTFRAFLNNKIRSIYLPFVTCNLFIIALKLWIYPSGIEKNLVLAVQTLFALNKDGQFFGATWFLGALFIISIAYKIVDEYIENTPWKRLIITACFVSLAVVAFEIKFPLMFSRTLILGMFYAIGYFVKCYQKELKSFDHWWLAAAGGIVFVVIGRYNSANMGTNEYRYPFAFVFGALLATYVVIFLSREMERRQQVWIIGKIQDCICYLGKKSIHIVIWQFVAFRIVIAVQMYLDGVSWNHILNYYPVYDASGYWWIAYTVVGLWVPVLWGNVLDGISAFLQKLRL